MTDQFANDQHWMTRALELAGNAQAEAEVPVGALLVQDEQIIGEGWNRPIISHDPTAHAEIQALRAAAKHLQNYRLPETTLYVTLEPCCMCSGAIIHARVKRVVYGATDPKGGASDSMFEILGTDKLNHVVTVSSGVMADECGQILKDFFSRRR